MRIILTSVANNYLPKAIVLARSLKKFHPDIHFVVVLSDIKLNKEKHLRLSEIDEIIEITNLPIKDFKNWAFKHDVEELCTAVKPIALKLLLQRKSVTELLFIDPDIKIFNSLDPIFNALKDNDVLLTPHLTHPESTINGIADNEIAALKHGIFNLGFLGLKKSKNAIEFVNWWEKRLSFFCYKDYLNGLWTDQKWVNLAVGFFDYIGIFRHDGCNVATWNASNRKITQSDGKFYVNNKPLIFYHFTGFDSGAGKIELAKYLHHNPLLKLIWDEYELNLKQIKLNNVNLDCCYAYFDSGEKISYQTRLAYRKNYDQFMQINPFSKSNSFFIVRRKLLIQNLSLFFNYLFRKIKLLKKIITS